MAGLQGPIDLGALAPDTERLAADLAALAAYRDPDAPGWTRAVFTDPYRAERGWVRDRMRDAGLEVRVDAAGNVIGRLAGASPSAPPLVTGSHTDTVHGGGRFDGVVGVLGGIEVARRLRETGTRLTRDLYVIDFLGEEANTLASAAWVVGPSPARSPARTWTAATPTAGGWAT